MPGLRIHLLRPLLQRAGRLGTSVWDKTIPVAPAATVQGTGRSPGWTGGPRDSLTGAGVVGGQSSHKGVTRGRCAAGKVLPGAPQCSFL